MTPIAIDHDQIVHPGGALFTPDLRDTSREDTRGDEHVVDAGAAVGVGGGGLWLGRIAWVHREQG